MINALIKRFIPEYNDVSNPLVRKKYGVLCGILGIIFNFILFAVKLCCGLFINSMAVTSDAFNNLSDMGSSFVSLFGARISGKRADREHPYGHGRAEYISAFAIAMLIIIFGFELVKSSVESIVNSSRVNAEILVLIILSVSVILKLYMWRYNLSIGKRIDSELLIASARDSLNDCIATTAVILSAAASRFTEFPIDSVAGIIVSIMIMVSGIKIARSITHRLMGMAPDEELIAEIERLLTENDEVLGMHDLLVHDYGPGKTIASVHAELPATLSLTDAHDIVDKTEHKIMDELSVDIVIHIDPIPHKF